MSRPHAHLTLAFAGLLILGAGCGSSSSGNSQPSTASGGATTATSDGSPTASSGGATTVASGGATAAASGGASAATTTSSSNTTTAKLVINELQPANKDTITDENGDADDWIEIYNPEAKAADLKGYSFSDSVNKQVIPGSLPVPPGGYLLIWADDSASQGNAHLGFKLSAKKGDTVTLADPSGQVVDTVTFGEATEQNVYARFPNGTGAFAWCAQASPGVANGSACGAP